MPHVKGIRNDKWNEMAGAGGFEPPVSGPEPGALPLGDAPRV
jgi:hypothetical protein